MSELDVAERFEAHRRLRGEVISSARSWCGSTLNSLTCSNVGTPTVAASADVISHLSPEMLFDA